MKKVLIIGAGQLGSRHLQGVLKSEIDFEVYVVDPNLSSLEIAKSRASEISHSKHITFSESIENIPSKIEVVIVATNANVREQVITKLLNTIEVQFLILEKVLFQDLEAYDTIEQLIQIKNIKTWVNHPRRMFEHYQEIKKQIQENSLQITNILATGNNWGLGCNGLHLLDLCAYLSNELKIETINTNQIDKRILASKRDGFIEFTGSLNVYFENKTYAEIISNDNENSSLTIFIATQKDKWLIREGNPISVIHLKDENTAPIEISEYKPQFQSELSALLVQDLLTLGTCKLPTYKEAYELHKPFINALLDFYNVIENKASTHLKIT
jgi:predicted dehydrogenase